MTATQRVIQVCLLTRKSDRVLRTEADIPVTLAFGGVPRVVNPVLTGATKRKTDVLDARLLAYHAITGMWPATFFVRQEVQTLRVCVQLRRRTEVERSNDSRCRE